MPESNFLTSHLSELTRIENVTQIMNGSAFINRVADVSSTRTRNILSVLNESTLFNEPPPSFSPAPPPQLESLEIDSGAIVFRDGVAVGGSSHLILRPDGTYRFTGHFHGSGAASYDTSFVWVVTSTSGLAFTFTHSGRTHGTFESGSRDDDWDNSGSNPAIADAWSAISQGYHWQWNSSVNSDIGQLLDAAINAVKTAIPIITTIIAIV